MPTVPPSVGTVSSHVLAHGHDVETLLADAVAGVLIALVLFALYYVFVLQRARAE